MHSITTIHFVRCRCRRELHKNNKTEPHQQLKVQEALRKKQKFQREHEEVSFASLRTDTQNSSLLNIFTIYLYIYNGRISLLNY